MMGFVDKGKDFATVFPETVANLKNTIQQYKPPQSSINAKWTGHVASRENRQRGAEL